MREEMETQEMKWKYLEPQWVGWSLFIAEMSSRPSHVVMRDVLRILQTLRNRDCRDAGSLEHTLVEKLQTIAA
jgi:hypothetical protein